MTPADVLAERRYEPFCGNGVLATINALADFSHSKAMADLVTAGKWKGELLVTLGKVAPPRYANFIGRYKDDADLPVRWAVAVAMGLIDNEAIAVPVLIQLLSRGDTKEEFETCEEKLTEMANWATFRGKLKVCLARDRDARWYWGASGRAIVGREGAEDVGVTGRI